MLKVIKIELEMMDVWDVKATDIKKYIISKGFENFKYDDNEDYGNIISLVYEYLNENNIKY